MTKILALTGLVLVLSTGAAIAQNGEQQVYYPPYMIRSDITQQDLINRQNYIIAQQQYNLENRNHIPRDPTAVYQGRIPMHPGDYRDAFDRGELPELGRSYKTNRPIGR